MNMGLSETSQDIEVVPFVTCDPSQGWGDTAIASEVQRPHLLPQSADIHSSSLLPTCLNLLLLPSQATSWSQTGHGSNLKITTYIFVVK